MLAVTCTLTILLTGTGKVEDPRRRIRPAGSHAIRSGRQEDTNARSLDDNVQALWHPREARPGIRELSLFRGATRSWDPPRLVGVVGHRFLHRGQQHQYLVSGHAATLRKVGVAAAPARERALDQVGRGQATALRRTVDRHNQ